MSSVDALLTALVSTTAFIELTRRGGGIQRSDLVRRLGRSLVGAELESRGHPPIDPRAVVPSADLDAVTDAVDAITPALLDGAVLARSVLDVLASQAGRRGLDVRLRQVGERVLTRVAHRQALLDESSEDEWIERVVAELLDALDRHDYVTAGEFARRYAARWDEEWALQGRHSLASHPPSAIRLGPDYPPSLVRADGRSSCSWFDGTGRSVYDRLALRWRGRSAPGDPHLGRPGHVSPTRLSGSPDAATDEIVRASKPYGLFSETHHQSLRGIYFGAGGGGRAGAWAALTAECRSGLGTEDLALAVGDCLDLALRGPLGSALGARLGDLASHSELIAAALVRKVWMDLHRREREFVEPLCTCMLSSYVRVAVDKAVPEALTAWLGSGLRVAEMEEEFDDSHQVGFADLIARENATWALLLEHRAVAEMVLRRSSGWVDAYRALFDHAGKGPSGYLSAEELEPYLPQTGDPMTTEEGR